MLGELHPGLPPCHLKNMVFETWRRWGLSEVRFFSSLIGSSSLPSVIDIYNVFHYHLNEDGLVTCSACCSGNGASLTTHVRVMHLRRFTLTLNMMYNLVHNGVVHPFTEREVCDVLRVHRCTTWKVHTGLNGTVEQQCPVTFLSVITELTSELLRVLWR